MIPILFRSTETEFTSYGIGALSNAIFCFVEEVRNGSYELTLEYPITGIHYAEINYRSIILAKANFIDAPQPFRVYKITKPINGKVTIYARHLSYDLSGVPVQPFTAAGIQSALNGLKSNAMTDISTWTFTTSRTTASTFKVDVPSSVKSWFGGKEGSLLDVYGGEWHYDGYTCALENSRGTDRGVTIRYGVNLTDLEQEGNCADVYTGVLAFWQDADGNLVQGTIQNTSGTFDFTKIYVLDCSQDYEEAPTASQLNAKAAAYIVNNNIGVPKVNLTLNFAMLEGLLNRVDLCDTVTVIFEKLGVEATAKCIRVRWNTLLDRYEEVELGDAKSELTEAILRADTAATAAVKAANQTKNIVDSRIETAVQKITGNLGGIIVLHDTNDDGVPDELLIMDNPDIDEATNVWRWNQQGLMHANSYTGEYTNIALTMDGQIVADAITTGILRGIEIISSDGTNLVDIVNGKITTSRSGEGRTETTNYNYRIYDDSGNLMANLTASAKNPTTGFQTGILTIDSNVARTQAMLTALANGGGMLRLANGTVVGVSIVADDGDGGTVRLYNGANAGAILEANNANLGGMLNLFWPDGTRKIYLGTLSLTGLMQDEPALAFYDTSGNITSWFAGNRGYIKNPSEQGFIVYGHTSAHGITVDFTTSGRIDFYVDTTYVGFASLSSSDEKTKTDIHPIEEKYKRAVEKVELKNFNFDFQNETLRGANDLLRFGAIAQDVIAALIEQGLDPEESELIDVVGSKDDQRYVINYVPFLLARLAADEDRIKDLKIRIQALESRLEAG